jgi:hypothetical protein
MVGKANRRGWGFIRKLPSKRYQASYIHELARHTAPRTFTALERMPRKPLTPL